MTKLEKLAEHYRVPVSRDECGDQVIRGTNGHLYTDDGAIMVCFTDDGRKKPFSGRKYKGNRLRLLPGIRLTQDGDYEFTGEIPESLVRTALFKVLRVRRFLASKGQPEPAHLLAARRAGKSAVPHKNAPYEP